MVILMVDGKRQRHWARAEIEGLDPERDAERIVHLGVEARYGEPLLAAALYTVAFCRQMAVPSIAAVVHRGGRSPIMLATRKRNDDTLFFFGEFMRRGHSSPRGQEAITRVREIHDGFPISEDQMLYTLASLTFEGDRVPALLGREVFTRPEKLANYNFWREVGGQLGIAAVPPSYEEFLDWTLAYERESYGFSAGGRAVAEVMIDDFARRCPPSARRAARELLPTVMDPPLRRALRLKDPRPVAARLASLGLGAYLAARDVLPDPPDRSWADEFGGAYENRPPLHEVGFQGEAR